MDGIWIKSKSESNEIREYRHLNGSQNSFFKNYNAKLYRGQNIPVPRVKYFKPFNW